MLVTPAAKIARLVVIGLDGLPLWLARDLCEAGHAPNLARILSLLEPAYIGELEAHLPELSPVNWTSFFTASSPAIHGVFGFTRIHAKNYTLHLSDFTQVCQPTLADRLGMKGYQSRIINMPNTYPARRILGTMLISGFVAHKLSHAVYPPYLLGPLQDMEYRLEANTSKGSDDLDFLLQELHATLQTRKKALQLLWHDLGWDMFILVLTETDRLFHFLLDAVIDSGHPYHAACMSFIWEWDSLLGDILDKTATLSTEYGRPRLLVLADHGFIPLKQEVDINTWLMQKGYLHLNFSSDYIHGSGHAQYDSTIILPSSKAFALDPGRIYLHSQERFAAGCLTAQEAVSLREDIREELLGLSFEGQPVMQAVYRAEELYTGPMLHKAPDLICLGQPGFDCKAKFDQRPLFSLQGRTGMHSHTGGIFVDSYGERPTTPAEVGQLILRHFKCGLPQE